MDTYTVYGIKGATPADRADRLEAYLLGKGYTVENIRARFDRRSGELDITVTADRDPTDDLRAYISTPTARETERQQRIAAGRATVAAARANPNAPRTPQEVNAFMTAVAELLPELQGV